MNLKQRGYSFCDLLIYTITIISCQPSLSQPDARLILHNDRSSVLTAVGITHPGNRENTERIHRHSRPGEEATTLRDFNNRDTQVETTGGPQHTLKLKMASTLTDKSLKTRNKLKRSEQKWMYTSFNPPNKDCTEGKIQHVVPGEFYISGQLEENPNVGYQSDSAAQVQAEGGQETSTGQRLSGSAESWQRLQPVVECGDDAMTLTVRRRRAVQLQLDRVNESSVPLSRLPPQCGYFVQTTWRDLSLMAQYDACHITVEDDSYVLPLLWRGTPVKMSCPVSQIQLQAAGPPSLCCSLYGMTVRVQGDSATEELRVNVRGEWTPLVVLAEQCGYTLDRRDAEIIIAAPFVTCGIIVKDGKHTLSLQIGENTFTLACPISLPEELPLTHQPLANSHHHLTTRHMPESLESFPWAPPFYLAPPYYPHPTYHHKYASPDGHDAFNPPSPSPVTPEPTSGPQPLHPYEIPVRESYKHFDVHSSLSRTDEEEDSGGLYPDLQQKQETPVLGVSDGHGAAHAPSSDTGLPTQAEPPPLQPPSHAFNPYYHYYHHPKIPFPGPTPDPDPKSLTNAHNPEQPVLPADVQQSEALRRVNSQQLLQPVPEAASHPYTAPPKASAPQTPHPPQPYPYHYYYFPHVAKGEAKRVAPLSSDKAAETKLSSSTLVHPQPRSSQVHDQYYFNPGIDQPDEVSDYPKNIRPLLSEEELHEKKRHSAPVTPAVQAPLPISSNPPGADTVRPLPPKQPSFPTPSPIHNLPANPYYHHPYYHYYQMYYGPESLPSADSRVSPPPPPPKEALDPLLEASPSPPPPHHKHQTTAPPTKSMYDVHNGHIHPYYYYYHHYFQPEASVRELHPAGSMNPEKASTSESPPPSDYRGMDWQVHAAEAGYPSIPQLLHSPVYSLDSHYVTQQHPHVPFGHPGGEEAEDRQDNKMKDQLQSGPYTPSAASPCGLGPVSDSDCSVSLGCCSYPVNDCTVGQHLVFAVPDSVVEPTVALPAHPSEASNVSCTLQKLTSDPHIYTVPLDGCGVNKQVFGQTVVHLLEVHGVHALQDNSPVRLMVECSSSLGSPGEVRLHVLDQPPPPPLQSPPATVTVQLRIATDYSFTSFHPEAHLPLSFLRGRPVYVEVSLLDAPEPGLVLLVHSCVAYTQAPYTSWMLVYDGCPSRSDSQLLPSPHSDPHHIRRILISGFLSLPSESPSYMTGGGQPHLEDPEIYFLCLTEVCSAADGDCTVGCINSPSSDV
ncbi:uncharacterized protein LOC125879895 [Epinephelus fuscoguttatus]|uniref:uncharacterized protein LOC125879895 n=1 Tax=Epinephelus fuscoguttatus TaxID=293821 RepID=UPI0020D03E1A|nr:uncharacterized protein LOC125879895 [Epinephelus fuscoguttatus]